MKTIVYIVAGLLVSLLLGSFIVPTDLTTERVMYVEATPAEIYPHLVDLQKWDRWEPWDTDPVGAKTRGEGARRGWPGGGVLVLDNAERDIRLQYIVEQRDPIESGNIELTPHRTKEGTVVVWTHFSETGYFPAARIAGWSQRATLALQIDDALTQLKQTVEGPEKTGG
ncbi:MAG: SRPBCC family protein [Myxococcota bacterium]